MSMNTTIRSNPGELVSAWKKTLPQTLNSGDSVDIQSDESNRAGLYIHFKSAGHSGYTFDFSVHYVDDREVEVKLLDVEKSGVHIDVHTEIVQTLVEDYVRHIHECAQILQSITHD